MAPAAGHRPDIEGLRAVVALAAGRLACALLLALLPLQALAHNGADYLAKIDSIKVGYLDKLWIQSAGQYESDEGAGRQAFTWLNAFMVETTAILAGRNRATPIDIERAGLVIEKLTTAPAYSRNTWTHSLSGDSPRHEAVDQPVAEALYFAWKYREALRLTPQAVAAISAILLTDRPLEGLYGGHSLQLATTNDNQNLAKWLLNRLTYSKLAGGSVDRDIGATVQRFVDHIDKPFGKPNNGQNAQSALFPDYGWRYIEAMGMFPSFEYGAMSLGGFLLFYPEISGVAPLGTLDKAKIAAWQRHIYGQWQRNGYPNWDTVWSDHRLHLLSYWLWSLRSLTGMVRTAGVFSDPTFAKHAKYLLDRSIDTHSAMDKWAGDPADGAVASGPFGVNYPQALGGLFNNAKSSGNAKFAMELALAVELGVADKPSADPGNIWGYNWHSQDVHVSTPSYSAASVPYAPRVGVWGADAVQSPGDGVSRIALPTGEILTSLGGYAQGAFSLRIIRDGKVDIDTGSMRAGRPEGQKIWVDGVLQSRKPFDVTPLAGDFKAQLRSLVTRRGVAYRSEVETIFHKDHITQTLRAIRVGAVGGARIEHTIPLRKGAIIEQSDGRILVRWPAAPDSGKPVELLIVPRSAGWAATSVPTGRGSRQLDQGQSLRLVLADSASVETVSFTYDVWITDCLGVESASRSDARSCCRLGHACRPRQQAVEQPR